MVSPRWRKLLGDLRVARGRLGIMAASLAVGIFGVATVLSAYTILTREITRNYLATNPASASLELDRVDDSLVGAVRRLPGIAAAEAGSTVLGRIQVGPGEWKPLLLFVVPDFRAWRIGIARPESGAWPPPDGSLLVERTALELVKARMGSKVKVQVQEGPEQEVALSGSVHDAGLAPAWQEQRVYGYVTPATLSRLEAGGPGLGDKGQLDTLKVVVRDQAQGEAAVDRTVEQLAVWLRQQGRVVHEIRIPPPGRHPHQSQMNAIMVMLLALSLMAAALSAVLSATLVGGLLAQQVRQIGVMKAVGARSWQIAGLYVSMIAAVGLAAVFLGLPLGLAAGRGFARVVAGLLNLTLASESVPAWVFLAQVAVGVVAPVLVALIPIHQATRTTVREALANYGVSQGAFGARRLETFLGRIRGLNRTMTLALRNLFRRTGRLALTLGLLSVAGAMFVASVNVKTAWEQYLVAGARQRHYDLEVQLSRPEPEGRLLSLLARIPEVRQVEAWNTAPAAAWRTDGLTVVRTYPDGGHGSLTLRSAPPASRMLTPTLEGGRWLRPGDDGTVVLNQMAQAFFPAAKVGGRITLGLDGRPVTLRVVGLAREILSPAAAYVTPETFAATTGQEGRVNALRLALTGQGPAVRSGTTRVVEQALDRAGVKTKLVISATALDRALSGHVYIFIFALLLMAVVMAVVGGLGLMSSIGTSVAERTREFGVMRTIGGRAGTVLATVIGEGVLTGLLSWVIGVVLSVPLAGLLGRLLGNLAFRAPLPLVLSPVAVAVWLAIIVSGSVAASAYPAWRAANLTVRETLAYV